MSRELKFELVENRKIIGYEVLGTFLNGGAYYHVLYSDPEQVCQAKVYFPKMLSSLERRQFTGLKDKNGKEIYEGDILKEESSGPAEVYFGTNTFMGGVLAWNFKYKERSYFLDVASAENFEVIGNIYENPELLK